MLPLFPPAQADKYTLRVNVPVRCGVNAADRIQASPGGNRSTIAVPRRDDQHPRSAGWTHLEAYS